MFILYSIFEVIDYLSLSIDFSIIKSIGKREKPSEWNSIFWFGLRSLIIAPIIEELIFRKPLKFSKRNSIILLLILLFSIITLIIKPNLNFFFLGAYALIMLSFYYFLKRKKKTLNYITLIFSSFVFGFFHLSNIELPGTNQWYLIVYKIFPLIVLGFGLGFIRLKLNTFWSVIGHTLFNLIPFIFKYIL